MWGQVVIVYDNAVIDRIIPTRVGTSGFYISIVDTGKDHPHACGDKGTVSGFSVVIKGSSPRVWGQAVADTEP